MLQVIALPENVAGADVCMFLVDENNHPVGMLSVACCRYTGTVPNNKIGSQDQTVQLSKQYSMNGLATDRTQAVCAALRAANFERFIEIQVRFGTCLID